MNYIQQAYKGNNEWFHWVITIIIVVFGWQVIGFIPLGLAAFKQAGSFKEFAKAAEDSFLTMGMNSNLLLFLMILMFFIGLIFLFIGVRYIHQRNIISLITSRECVDWKRFWVGFYSWGFVAVLTTIIGILLMPEDYIWNFNAGPFFTLVLISLLFLPFQTSFEELLFRGYFMQGLGVLAKNRWFPLIFTSIVFGLLHSANPEVEKLGYIVMVFYIGTGFFYGIITLMDEGTELALGLHAVNNIVAAFLVTTDWMVFQTDALYIDTSEPSVGWEMFFPVLVLYPLMLLFFSRKYGWKNWIEKLTGSIEQPVYIKDNYSLLDDIGTK
jgi:membrane protease YdiL (CAAX protease family)